MGKDLRVCSLLDVYGCFLGDKQRRLTEYYYNDDLSLAEIAENEEMTRQGVLDAIKRAVKQLNELEEKCNYCSKFYRLKQLSQAARNGVLSDYSEMLDIIDNI